MDVVGSREVVGGERHDGRRHHDAETDADGSGGERDQQPFGDVLHRELAAAGAERHPHRGFAGPRHRPGEQQPGGAGARDEEQQRGRRKEQQERWTDPLDDGLVQVAHPRRVGRPALRVLRHECGSHPGHIGRHRGGADTRLAPRVDVIAAAVALGDVERRPDIHAVGSHGLTGHRQVEGRGHHAGDRIGTAVEREPLPDDGRIGSEALPQRVRDHGRAVVVEPAAERRLDTELVHQRDRDGNALHVKRLDAVHQVLAALTKPAERVEGRGPLLVRLRVAVRQGYLPPGLDAVRLEERHEAGALAISERLQHHAVDDGVDGRRRPDADGQRERGQQRDALRAPPRSPRL